MLRPANLPEFDRWERRGSSVADVKGRAEEFDGYASVPAETAYVQYTDGSEESSAYVSQDKGFGI